MPRPVRSSGARSAAAAVPPVVVVDADDPLIPRVQAAPIVGATPATMRDWACKRVGPPFVKRGASKQGRCFYRLSDLQKWLSSCSRVVGN